MYGLVKGRLPFEQGRLNSSMTFQIRRATLKDVVPIARVHVLGWQTSYTHLLPAEFLKNLQVSARAERWQGIFERGDSVTLVAEQENEVVGFVSVGPSLSSIPEFEGEIHALYTLERVQGHGLGRLLFDVAREYLLEQAMPNMALWTLRDNPARGFYQRLDGILLEQQREIEIGGVKLLEVAYGWNFGTHPTEH